MSIVALLLVAIWVLDALRLRRRLERLPRVQASLQSAATPETADQASTEEDSRAALRSSYRALLAPGVSAKEAKLSLAADHAASFGLEAADLIPGDLATESFLGLLATYEAEKWTEDPFRPARSAGQVLIFSEALGERAQVPAASSLASDQEKSAAMPCSVAPSMKHFLEAAAELRRCAPAKSGLLLVPTLKAKGHSLDNQRDLFESVAGRGTPFLLGAQALLYLLIFLTLLYAPLFGLLTLVAFHLQPLIVFWGSEQRPHDLSTILIARTPVGIAHWFSLLPRRSHAAAETDPATQDEQAQKVQEARRFYAEATKDGLGKFFEPRRQQCPMCQSEQLRLHLQTTDLFQYKPGTFHLDRCEGCGLIFQNPRLSLDGLNYYYKDFYDGLGEKSMESVFGASLPAYRARAETLIGMAQPKTWLDVGGGHGHFCALARQSWPETRFEILDLADSVDDAVRRGWADAGHQGLFPEMAPSLPRYDVISMSHYLEHTREPKEEIAAASLALNEGGHLLIEVPDPESKLGDILKRYWVPFFQPQHQHLLSAKHLETILRANGLEPIRWHRGAAHIPVDFLMAAWIFVSKSAGSPGRPWLPLPTFRDRLRYGLVWSGLFWMLPAGWLLDRLLKGSLSRGGRSNAYRVLARKTEA